MNINYRSSVVAVTVMTVALVAQTVFLGSGPSIREVGTTSGTAALAVAALWVFDTGIDALGS